MTAQRLARHSTPMLTANVYSHVLPEDKVAAIASLPAPRFLDMGLTKLVPGSARPCPALHNSGESVILEVASKPVADAQLSTTLHGNAQGIG